MNQDIAISVQDLSKTFEIKSSANSLRNYISSIGRKEKIVFHDALKKISFDVIQGECLGVIGSNGAGKSTLLKILSKIIWPDKGRIELSGKVASLLEVGTGFYPDLSGRENIYLNGALLGMSKVDVNKYLDEIIDFSGIEKYIDSPVRYYSSGMYVRLGFSVAAFLRQDILLVDEVLAVGDKSFREKCLDKINDSLNKQEKTILFVSHDMSSVLNVCTRTLLLENGQTKYLGDTRQAIKNYLNSDKKANKFYTQNGITVDLVTCNDKVCIDEKIVCNAGDELVIDLILNAQSVIKDCLINFQFRNSTGMALGNINNAVSDFPVFGLIGKRTLRCTIHKVPFVPGEYQIDLIIKDQATELIRLMNFITLSVTGNNFFGSGLVEPFHKGSIYIDNTWS